MPPKKALPISSHKLDLLSVVPKAIQGNTTALNKVISNSREIDLNGFTANFSYEGVEYDGNCMTDVGFIVVNCSQEEIEWLLQNYLPQLNVTAVAYALVFIKQHDRVDALLKTQEIDPYYIACGAIHVLKQRDDAEQYAYLVRVYNHFSKSPQYKEQVPLAILESGMITTPQYLQKLLLKLNHEALNMTLLKSLEKASTRFHQQVKHSKTIGYKWQYFKKLALGMYPEGSLPTLNYGTPASGIHQCAIEVLALRKKHQLTCRDAVIWFKYGEIMTFFMRGGLDGSLPQVLQSIILGYCLDVDIEMTPLTALYSQVTGGQQFPDKAPPVAETTYSPASLMSGR